MRATPPVEIWYISQSVLVSNVADILFALGNEKIELIPLHYNESPTNEGILFFDAQNKLPSLITFIKQLKQRGACSIMGICITNIPLGWSLPLVQAGITELLSWPNYSLSNVCTKIHRWKSIAQQADLLSSRLVGKSTVWKNCLRKIVEIASSDSPVLIYGESGTGKELIAKAIHELDQRPNKRELVTVDCTSLNQELAGSELFGHEKGAFTNAYYSRNGAFAEANNGSLFLDELGELSPHLQAELLRVIQEKTYRKIGTNAWQKTNFRLISATNRNLEEEISKGNFRQDLFFRINGWQFHVPALKDRKEDIPILADFFLKKNNHHTTFEPEMYEFLIQKNYPGNVRELENLVNKMAYRNHGQGSISFCHIPIEDWPRSPDLADQALKTEFYRLLSKMILSGYNLNDLKNTVIENAKEIAVTIENGNVQKAAERLGCSDRLLQLYLHKSN
jgi:transcriptional regulator with GAF, ATPase, and Fis domain